MKFLLFLLITMIVMYFLWNIAKRILFKKIFDNFPNNPQQNQTEHRSSKKVEKKLNWDAETVDFEEVPSEKSAETKSKN